MPEHVTPNVVDLIDLEIEQVERDLISLRRTREILKAREGIAQRDLPLINGAVPSFKQLMTLPLPKAGSVIEGSLGFVILEALRASRVPLSPTELTRMAGVAGKDPTAKNVAATLTRYVRNGKIRRVGVGRYVIAEGADANLEHK
jgi:hypothetical protein